MNEIGRLNEVFNQIQNEKFIKKDIRGLFSIENQLVKENFHVKMENRNLQLMCDEQAKELEMY